jgi:hypothetical protein
MQQHHAARQGDRQHARLGLAAARSTPSTTSGRGAALRHVSSAGQ